MYSGKQDYDEYENNTKHTNSDNKRKNFYNAENPKTRKLDKSKHYNDYVSKEDILRRDLKRAEDTNGILNNRLCQQVCENSVVKDRLSLCTQTLEVSIKRTNELEDLLKIEKLKNQVIPLKNAKNAYQIIRKKTVTCKDRSTDTKSLKNPAARPIQTQTLKFNPEQSSVRTQVCAADLGVGNLDSDVKFPSQSETCNDQRLVLKSEYDKLFKKHKQSAANYAEKGAQLNRRVSSLVEEAQVWEAGFESAQNFIQEMGLCEKFKKWKLINTEPEGLDEISQSKPKLKPSKD